MTDGGDAGTPAGADRGDAGVPHGDGTSPDAADRGAAPRTWPRGSTIAPADALAAQCGTCGLAWQVHTSLAGFRLRCDCGAWIAMPAPPDPPRLAAPPSAVAERGLPARVDASRRDAEGLIVLPRDPGATVFTPIDPALPMAAGTLVDASPTNRARWTNRTLLEFGAMLAALLGPQLAALLWTRGQELELLLPFTSLASGVLVALVAAFAGPYGRLGFVRAAPRHFANALLAAAAGVALAFLWLLVLRQAFPDLADPLRDLRERLGLPMLLFVVAVAPAVLEEVMFRGLLQGRLLALLGTRVGLVTTAAAFALCHAQPAVLPVHLGLGLYLGWLRLRSGSLLPGMLMHFAYNGAIVVVGVG
jgi:membrane protease YdiL (CAAX protease family)